MGLDARHQSNYNQYRTPDNIIKGIREQHLNLLLQCINGSCTPRGFKHLISLLTSFRGLYQPTQVDPYIFFAFLFYLFLSADAF